MKKGRLHTVGNKLTRGNFPQNSKGNLNVVFLIFGIDLKERG